MTTAIPVQMTQQGLLIPRTVIQEWVEQGIEVVKDKQSIVIRPRPGSIVVRARALYAEIKAGDRALAEKYQPLVAETMPAYNA